MDMILEAHALICNWCNEILPQGPQEIFHYNVRLPVLVHGGKTTDLIHLDCDTPLGIQSGDIPNSDITSSSEVSSTGGE